jgi:methionine synthase II (cobalamin-independent)
VRVAIVRCRWALLEEESGVLPSAVQARVDSIESVDELARLLRQILRTVSLDELGLGG